MTPKKRVQLFLFLFLSILALFPLSALAAHQPQYHLKLLAVQESSQGYLGSDADVYLELQEGSGRVFLETYPLTKMDTQISTRFAKEIACAHFKLDCSNYDFIFTIKSKSSIIGGPSAGAAIAALTTIAVLDLPYDENIAITGTVNSGGIIGPVGGVKEKIEAASQTGLKTVLIAQGTALHTDDDSNQTLDLILYGKETLGINVMEVNDLDEVILKLTGVDLNHKSVQLTEDPTYKTIIQGLQRTLCQRTEKIESELGQRNILLDANITPIILQKKGQADNATLQGDYYSAASYCFGVNIQLKTYYYQHEDLTVEEMEGLFSLLEGKLKTTDQKLAQQTIETIADLQTTMIVKERLQDVREQMAEFKENQDIQSPEELAGLIAYAEERYFSAQSWMQFFSMDGKKFIVDAEMLENTCRRKVSEAEEWHQYVNLFIDDFATSSIADKIQTAKAAQNRTEYELCLITASQAKADANAILSSIGVSEDSVDAFIENKRLAAERVIAENSAESIFPILGYSYYRYANSLKHDEKFTALVYLEYALEMSDLGIYFPEEQQYASEASALPLLPERWAFGIGGVLVGVSIGFLLFFLNIKKRKR